MLKTFYNTHLQRTLKMGRTRPITSLPVLSFTDYIKAKIPAYPSKFSFATLAQTVLAQMYMNATLGCCVITCMAKIVGTWMANAGIPPLIFTDDQIIALYSAIGGYVPGVPNTDNGCDEGAALNYMMQQGSPAGEHKIAGFIAVNGQDPIEYKFALWAMENLFFGCELPDSYLNIGPNFTWGPGVPNPQNGHAFPGVGYDESGITVGTWAMTGQFLDTAINELITAPNGGELYVLISQDSINRASGKAGDGVIDWAGMVADFNGLGGTLVNPTPPPPPPPPPVNPVPPNIKQAIDALFVQFEDHFKNRPNIEDVLLHLQGYVDAYLATTMARMGHRSLPGTSQVPAILLKVFDVAIQALIAVHPEWAGAASDISQWIHQIVK